MQRHNKIFLRRIPAAVLSLGLIASSSLTSMVVAAGALTEKDVKTVIEKVTPTNKFVWKSVQIAAPRKASAGEISAAGLPPNCTVNVVKTEYTQFNGQGPWRRDHVQYWYFYKDDFGAWNKQADATTGNSTSEEHQ